MIGTYFEADRDTVHQAIVSFTTGLPSENWIKSVARHRNGKRSMKALCDQFSGEGNDTRRISEAERIRDTLVYKNERSLTFETFLTKCEKMYNIFETHGEMMEEDAKIRFIFKNIQHSGLGPDIAALKASITTSPAGSVSYTIVCNHLSTSVSQLPEFVSQQRNVSAIGQTNETDGQLPQNADGSLKVDEWLPNWHQLSKEDKQKIISERRRLGLRLGKGGKGTNDAVGNSE